MHLIRCSLILTALFSGYEVSAQAVSAQAVKSNSIRLELFVRGDSDTSMQAARFVQNFGDNTTGLHVAVHDILKDQEQLLKLWKLARRFGYEKPVVPAYYCCDRLQFGFNGPDDTRKLIEELFTVDVYTRSTCPKCIQAKAFIRQLGPQWPALRFRTFEITSDIEARLRWQELCRSHGMVPGLPTIDFAGRVLVGYQGDGITGVQLEQLIRNAAANQSQRGPAAMPSDRSSHTPGRISAHQSVLGFHPFLFSQATVVDGASALDPMGATDDVPLPDGLQLDEIPEESPHDSEPQVVDVINVPVLGELSMTRLGLPLFTFLVGLVDGFNPCAMWILVFLLSVLVNIKDRRKILLIAGTFVVVSGLAYFAFMAAWLNLFLLIGIVRPVQIILGVLALLIGVINIKDFFAFKKGVSLSIPESSKPGLYRRVREIVTAKYLTVALTGVVALAVVVNMVELLCTAGLPAVYTQILTLQDLPVWKNYSYLALYISAYMLDDAMLLTIVVATLSHRKLQEREGRWLKLISGIVILALALAMLFKPSWLQLS